MNILAWNLDLPVWAQVAVVAVVLAVAIHQETRGGGEMDRGRGNDPKSSTGMASEYRTLEDVPTSVVLEEIIQREGFSDKFRAEAQEWLDQHGE